MSKDIFISHAWGKDSLNRNNHIRCKELTNKLIKSGYKVWFDDYDMYGNIDSSIIKGINNSKIIILCLTKSYCDKINNAVHMQCPNDNCFKEWNYSLFKKKTIIPIIMDTTMKDEFFNGDGVIQMYLNSTMFMDMTENLEDDCDILKKSLRRFDIYNKAEKKMYNIKSNNSFENLTYLINNVVRNLSPRLSKDFSSKDFSSKDFSSKVKNKKILTNICLYNKFFTKHLKKPKIIIRL